MLRSRRISLPPPPPNCQEVWQIDEAIIIQSIFLLVMGSVLKHHKSILVSKHIVIRFGPAGNITGRPPDDVQFVVVARC